MYGTIQLNIDINIKNDYVKHFPFDVLILNFI